MEHLANVASTVDVNSKSLSGPVMVPTDQSGSLFTRPSQSYGATNTHFYTEQLMSDAVSSQYHSLITEQAQAAAFKMILSPGSTDPRNSMNMGAPQVPLNPLPQPTEAVPIIQQWNSVKFAENNAPALLTVVNTPFVTTETQEPAMVDQEKGRPGKTKLSVRRSKAKERPVDKYKCSLCSYTSRWSHGLTNHKRTHNNTVFKCSHCEYSTPWKGDLTNHQRVHNGTQFHCGECDYKSNKKQGLQKHMRMHTGAKPFKCTECSYESSQPGNLKKHMMRHSGEKPISCPHCDYRCRQKQQLPSHLEQYHSDIDKLELQGKGAVPFSARTVKKNNAWVKKKGSETEYKCHSCGFCWRSKLSYLKHMKSTHQFSKITPSPSDNSQDVSQAKITSEFISPTADTAQKDFSLPANNQTNTNASAMQTLSSFNSLNQTPQIAAPALNSNMSSHLPALSQPIAAEVLAQNFSSIGSDGTNPSSDRHVPGNEPVFQNMEKGQLPIKITSSDTLSYHTLTGSAPSDKPRFVCGHVCAAGFKTEEDMLIHRAQHLPMSTNDYSAQQYRPTTREFGTDTSDLMNH